ncbi:MAG: hypothetical protein DMF63_01815 [Acidobacteria bacterium]|nr:MAG: hypothetical protein DMF63_01815 [Acidobacteriota bacterium]
MHLIDLREIQNAHASQHIRREPKYFNRTLLTPVGQQRRVVTLQHQERRCFTGYLGPGFLYVHVRSGTCVVASTFLGYNLVAPKTVAENACLRTLWTEDKSDVQEMSLSKPSTVSQKNLTGRNIAADWTYEFEDFRLDPAHLMLYKHDVVVPLKPKVVETLIALVERSGQVVGKDELMNRLWGDSFVEESNLTQNIYLLRKCLGNCADGQPFIENFARRGYRFNGRLKPAVDVELVLARHIETKTVVEEIEASRSRWTWITAVVAIGILVGAVSFAVRQMNIPSNASEMSNSSAAPFQTFSMRRHSDSNDVSGGVISHDGKFIFYTSKQNGLWLKNTATNDAIRILADTDAVERSVISFSPDDNFIYFFDRGDDKNSRVARMSVIGGAVERIKIEDSWSGASMSPDGTQLAFIRHNSKTGKQTLIVANTDGTGEYEAVRSRDEEWFGLWDRTTTWSPDGTRIAVVSGSQVDGRSAWHIKVFRAVDGEGLSTITSAPDWRWIDSVLWMPDGDHLLAIGGDNTSQGQIYEHTLSSGEWRRLTNDLTNYVLLSVTGDGKTVVTVQHENPGNLWLLPASGNASEAKQITSGRNLMTEATGVSWTPDGKIVYATNDGAQWAIMTVKADGSDQKQLTRNCAGNDTCSQPVVTHDGRYIVFQARRNGVPNIWRMDADGDNPVQLTRDGGFSPAISPDGRTIVYTNYSPTEMFWRVPMDGGPAEQFSTIRSVGDVSFAPDGKQMAFSYWDKAAKQPFQTCVADLAAAVPEKCFGISRSFPRWAADSRAFYYLDHGFLGIWKQPLDGEPTMFVQFPGERTNNFAFSPDGKYLVVARSKPTNDIVALTDER